MKWRQSRYGFYYFLRVCFFAPCLEITVIGVWTGIVKVVKNSLAQNFDNILARVAWPSIHQHLQEQLHHHHHCNALWGIGTISMHSQVPQPENIFWSNIWKKKNLTKKSYAFLQEMAKAKNVTDWKKGKKSTSFAELKLSFAVYKIRLTFFCFLHKADKKRL